MNSTIQSYTIPFAALKLSIEDLANKSRSSKALILASCPDIISDANENVLIKAETTLATFSSDFDTATVRIDGKQFYVGSKLVKKMRNAQQCVIFACTSGDALSGIAHESSQNKDYLKGYYYDLFENMIIERATEYLSSEMKNRYHIQQLPHSNKFGPGYCDWSLSDQKRLLNLISNKHVAISVSDDSLMLPIKTLTGIWVVGKKVKFQKDTCAFCESHECLYQSKIAI